LGETASNFIEFLRSEKMSNETAEFRRVYQELEPLTFSHALIVVNRREIVEKLVELLGGNFTEEEMESNPNLAIA